MYFIETFENMVEMYTTPIKIKENNLDKTLKYSYITLFFRNLAKKIQPYTKNVSQVNFVTISLLFNAFALYNLFINEYEIFIVLLFTSYFVDIIYQINIDVSINTRFSQKYYIIAGWIRLIYISFFIYIIYFKKIKPIILLILLFLTILNNLHYSLQQPDKTFWDYIIKNKDRKKLLKLTSNFDETMIVLYFIIIIIYIHYS